MKILGWPLFSFLFKRRENFSLFCLNEYDILPMKLANWLLLILIFIEITSCLMWSTFVHWKWRWSGEQQQKWQEMTDNQKNQIDLTLNYILIAIINWAKLMKMNKKKVKNCWDEFLQIEVTAANDEDEGIIIFHFLSYQV